MKNFYLSLCIFGAALGSQPATGQAHVQTNTKYVGSASTAISLAFSSASTAGHLIVVHFSYDNITRSVSTVVDNKGNTYTKINGPTTWNTTFRSELWYAFNIKVVPSAATPIDITATLTGSSTSYIQIYMSEYSGIDIVSPLDKRAINTGTATAFNSGAAVTSAPNELIYGVSIGSNGNLALAGTFTARSTANGNVVEDKIGAAAGAYSATFTSVAGNHWVAEMATFKPFVPLPMKLISFDAHVINENTVQLDWITAMESNNDYFEVQHSHDGLEWTVVSKMKGAGNSTSATQYAATDNNPYMGHTYYRLLQADLDGKTTYSEIKLININQTTTSKIRLYPVPAIDHMTVEGNSADLRDIAVVNSIGQWVNDRVRITRESDSRDVLDLSLLPKGIYFLKTRSTSYTFYKQ